LFQHGREIWIVIDDVSNNKIRDYVSSLEHFLYLAHSRCNWKDGNYFTFINLKKFCWKAKELILFFRRIHYVKQSDSHRRHKFDMLYDQLNGFEIQLQNYGQKEAYDLFNVDRIEMISEVASMTRLKIA
jgi:hypothetical protein